MRKKKSIILLVLFLALVEISTLFLMYKSFSNRDINLNKTTYSKNLFAILVEQDDGTYKETTDNSWNSDDFTFNNTKSGCVDLSGNELNNVLSYKNGIASVTTTESVYCYLYFDKLPELVGDAYALLLDAGYSFVNYSGSEIPAYELIFVRSETPIEKGDSHNNKTILNVYSDIENKMWNVTSSGEIIQTSDVPWYGVENNIINVAFEDEIRPISTRGWFYGIGAGNLNFPTEKVTINLNNLNTLLVTDMSHMFFAIFGISDLNIIGLNNLNVSRVTDMSRMFLGIGSRNSTVAGLNFSNWDVSSVTNMSEMFNGIAEMAGNALLTGLSSWDVSNVTDMSGMFGGPPGTEVICDDISNWDTGHVTDMSYMFNNAMLIGIGNIAKWNVSNVTDMSAMFQDATINEDLDLSGWDVSKVSNYENFADLDINSTGTLTPPKWSN